jgi:ABC-type branched-subunit amino acid transport system substrate-binding protein
VATSVGILVGELIPGRNHDWVEIWSNCFALALDEALERHALDHPVELVTRAVEGLPTGSQANVVGAWRELQAEGVVAILGPSNADNGMAVRATADEGRTPTVLFGCSEQLAGEWTFSVPWGAAADDAYLALNWVVHQGHRRIALLWDSAWHAGEWHAYARLAAQRYGIEIAGDVRIPAAATCEEGRAHQLDLARRGVERMQALGPDAIVMMTSHGSVPFATAVVESGWDVPRVVVGGSFGVARRLPELFTGWVGTCLWDDTNPMFTRFIAAYEKRFGTRPLEDMAIVVYDGCRAVLEGLSLAPILTRDGLRTGLERVKGLPATSGAPGTVLSFGPHDHRAYKGRNTSILRRQVDGTTDGCVFEGYFT